jgi:hypothetical protein
MEKIATLYERFRVLKRRFKRRELSRWRNGGVGTAVFTNRGRRQWKPNDLDPP